MKKLAMVTAIISAFGMGCSIEDERDRVETDSLDAKGDGEVPVTVLDSDECNLEAKVTILKGTDDGAYGFELFLSNRKDDDDVVALRINDDTSAFIMVSITNGAGKLISREPTIFSIDRGAPQQKFKNIQISRKSPHVWFVPFADVLKVAISSDQTAQLAVHLSFRFRRITNDKQSLDTEFQPALLTVYDSKINLTTAALKGNAEEKYKKYKL